MRIMSFNIQHCEEYRKNKINFEVFANVIRELGVDAVGIQEARDLGPTDGYEDQIGMLSKLSGLCHGFFAKAIDVGGKNPYGNGFISRFSVTEYEKIMIPDPNPKEYDGYYETRCILKVRLENGLCIIVTHFGLNPDEQENAVRTLLSCIEDEKCVVMGDFNVTPDSEILLPIREKMLDTAEFFETSKFSFPSDKPDKKIDYIFVSKDIRVLFADIPALSVSDHRPYVCEIEF